MWNKFQIKTTDINSQAVTKIQTKQFSKAYPQFIFNDSLPAKPYFSVDRQKQPIEVFLGKGVLKICDNNFLRSEYVNDKNLFRY